MKSVQCWKLYDYNVHENSAYYEGSNFRDIYPEKTCRNIKRYMLPMALSFSTSTIITPFSLRRLEVFSKLLSAQPSFLIKL